MKGIVLTAMDDEIYEVLSDNEIFADLFVPCLGEIRLSGRICWSRKTKRKLCV